MKEYWKGFLKKQLENFASAKMLMFLLPFIMSTIFMSIIIGKISDPKIMSDTFIAWCTFNVSLAGTISVVRGVFQVSQITALNSGHPDANNDIKKVGK